MMLGPFWGVGPPIIAQHYQLHSIHYNVNVFIAFDRSNLIKNVMILKKLFKKLVEKCDTWKQEINEKYEKRIEEKVIMNEKHVKWNRITRNK